MKPYIPYIIAIDPGERWTGFGILSLDNRGRRFGDMGFLDGKEDFYYAVDFLDRLVGYYRPNYVIVEDFQTRPVGHQRFSKALTARLIGAMEYTVRKYEGTEWRMEQPGDPVKGLKLLKLSQTMMYWKQVWPKPSDRSWNHAMSAWRVLGQHLIRTDPDLLRSLRFRMPKSGISPYEEHLRDMSESRETQCSYLWAPSAQMR